MSSLWITDDGSYGTGKSMIIDTTNWTEQDWLEFESASDNSRMATAIEIGEKYGNL